ncbi:hypothetical protein [Streptomyces sp. TE5632]
METEQRSVERPFRWRAVAVGCAVLAVVASWSGLLMVVAGRVVPGWGVSCVLLGVALVLLVCVRNTAEGVNKPPRVPRWMIISSTAAAALGIAFGAGGDLINGAEYFVLEPEGPGGCRAVVRETSFLVIGTGEVYEVGSSGLGRRIGSWTVDDGHRPFRFGAYELDWGQDGGNLSVHGTSGNPVLWHDIPEIDC